MEIAVEGPQELRANLRPNGLSLEPSSSISEGTNLFDETGDEEGDVCRICRTSGDPDNPLYYPCACSGSIKFVHQECLLQWLNHSHARRCEVCKHAFSFSPVYAENAPSRLPLREVLFGTTTKAYHALCFFFRLSCVLSIWLIFIPFTTFWIWRLSFVRSLGEAQNLFLIRVSPSRFSSALLTDCLHGFLLSAGIVFVFLGATSLREYFRHLREIERQNAERGDDGRDRQNGGRAGRQLLGPGDGVQAGGGNGEGGGQVFVGAGDLIRRNAENVVARLDMQAARLEARVEQIFDGGDDADGVEDVPFDELAGMQGPVFHLVENAITVLARNMIFLGVVIFLPFTLGRMVLSIASRLAVTTTGVLLTTGMSGTGSALALANITLKNTLKLVTNLSTNSLAESVFDQSREGLAGKMMSDMPQADDTASIVMGGASVDVLTETLFTSLRLSDAATLSMGYMVTFLMVFGYIGLVFLIRFSRGEALIVGRMYGVASVAEAAPSLARQLLAGLKYFFTMLKVAFLLLVEIGAFPLVCGWWLDVCTISMLGTTIAQRVAFFWASPLTSSFLHWLVGIVYMLQISVFVSLLREVLRPGVLYFLRDPADPNYNPFRDLIDDPIHKHARRVLLSIVVYGSLIVLLVFLPVKLAMHLAPSMFPLDTSVADPLTEIPADLLLFHICIPFAIEHFKPRATFKTLIFHWFSVVGWMLGLSDFLLPGPEYRDVQANGNADQARHLRLQVVHRGGVQEQNRNRLALPAVGDAGRLAHGNENMAYEESDGDDQADSEEYKFAMCIVLLLLVAWLTFLIFNSAVVVVPISMGRAVFSFIPRLPITHGVKCNDLYAFNMGCYIIWAAAAGLGYAVDYLKAQSYKVLFTQLVKWSTIVVKSCILLSLWIVVIPVFIGLLFELLVVVPLRVPVDESPVFLLYQDWALGLIFLKIWTKLVLLGQMAPLADESWRIKFEQVRADGFSHLRGLWVLREIVAPILMKLLTALCVPYVFARGLFPLFGYSLVVNSAVYRFATSIVTSIPADRLRRWTSMAAGVAGYCAMPAGAACDMRRLGIHRPKGLEALNICPSLSRHLGICSGSLFVRHNCGHNSRRIVCEVSDDSTNILRPTSLESDGDVDFMPTPIVLIDQDSDPNATVVEISFGDRLGALIDTMKALIDLGLDVVKGRVFTESSVIRTKFFITRLDTGRKIENPELLERIRLTIINNLLKYHPESSENLAMGEAFGIKPPKKKLDIDVATHIHVADDGPRRSMLYIETADRPGLLMEIVKIMADINVNVESAEIDTEGLVAKDKFYVSYRGAALSSSMAEVLTNCLRYYIRRPETDEDSY